jgi:tRNA pseudouridine38-40 synthase
MLVAYDGTDFHGFAANAGVPTVGGALRAAIERVLGTAIELTAAGRTDTGVHAWGQVVSFEAPGDGLDLIRLQRSVNGLCGPAIVARAIEFAPPHFDARFTALWRCYRYTVLNRPVPDPFLDRVTWHVPEPLDVASMRLAADVLVGEHDFSSFCRVPRGRDPRHVSLVRRVTAATWLDLGDGRLRFDIRANAFCHQMVRSLVGLLVDVGRGRRRAGDALGILRARDRAGVSTIAPPGGLCLWAVGYPDGFGEH